MSYTIVEAFTTETDQRESDEESGKVAGTPVTENAAMAPVYGLDRPFYHADVPGAVEAAVYNARSKDDVVDVPSPPCDSLP